MANNIAIDEALVEQAKRAGGHKTGKQLPIVLHSPAASR